MKKASFLGDIASAISIDSPGLMAQGEQLMHEPDNVWHPSLPIFTLPRETQRTPWDKSCTRNQTLLQLDQIDKVEVPSVIGPCPDYSKFCNSTKQHQSSRISSTRQWRQANWQLHTRLTARPQGLLHQLMSALCPLHVSPQNCRTQ